MGAINKILNMMKMTEDMDDEYDDIDDGYYEDDYEEEPKPKKKLFTPKPKQEEYYDDEMYNPRPSKVTPMRQPARRGGRACRA